MNFTNETNYGINNLIDICKMAFLKVLKFFEREQGLNRDFLKKNYLSKISEVFFTNSLH